jgi:hypothetical protein
MMQPAIEFFTLRRAGEVGRALDPAVRDRAAARLRLGRQRDEAARELWTTRHRAEALRLAREALADTLEAATALPHEDADARRLPDGELPADEEDVSDAHAARFAEMRRVRARIDRAIAPALCVRAERAALRAVRIAALMAGTALAAALGYVWFTRPAPWGATASAHHTDPPGFAPARAIDGDAYTEWLLPLGETGWLDVTFPRPRTLSAVRLLNAHNRGNNDMATCNFRIEAFAGTRAVASFAGAFATLDPQPIWHTIQLPATGVTRVRIWVDSYHSAGGGLAEVDFR